MAQAPTDAQNSWVSRVLDLDPAAAATSRRTAVQQAATGARNLVGDAISGVKIGAESVGQAARGLKSDLGYARKDAGAALRKVVGWGPPATAAPTGPVNLTSKTEVRAPANRTRTRLGVGERVVLKVTGGSGNWRASGAVLSAKTGTVVTMTAPPRPGSVTVSVDVGGTQRSLSFTVIAPSTVRMVVASTEHIDNSLPNAGMHCECYIGPDDVNFGETTNSEDDIRAKASGCWDEFNGAGHGPSPSPNTCDAGTVTPGLGTHSPGTDHIWSGYIPQPVPPNGDWSGRMTYDIPWHWQCGSGAGLISHVVHRQVTDAAGTTTISKGGASYTAALSP